MTTPWTDGPCGQPAEYPFAVDGQPIVVCPFCLDAAMTEHHRCEGLLAALGSLNYPSTPPPRRTFIPAGGTGRVARPRRGFYPHRSES